MTLDEAPALSGDHSFAQHAFTAQIEDELNVTLQHQSASLVNESSPNVSVADTDVTSSHDDEEEHVSVDPVEPETDRAEVQETERPESPEKLQVLTS